MKGKWGCVGNRCPMARTVARDGVSAGPLVRWSKYASVGPENGEKEKEMRVLARLDVLGGIGVIVRAKCGVCYVMECAAGNVDKIETSSHVR